MNPSKLLRFAPYEAPDPIDLDLSSAFHLHADRLKPPFPLDIPSPSNYASLCRALAYGVLIEPSTAAVHFKHLHAVVTDGYGLFTAALADVAHGIYPKLLDWARKQLLWALPRLIDVEATGVERLVISLLRRVNGGDFSEPNLWLSGELVRLLSQKWEWLVEEPETLTSAVFVFLRLLADHYRLGGDWKLDTLKQLEVDFCVRALREKFGLCLGIGRDLIRLLQDLVGIPEFRDIWKDLLFKPGAFGFASFSDISQIYRTNTPPRYSLLRISVEMEVQIRFLLTHVKWGSQRRYQVWFGKKFLSKPEQETLIPDLIRFICCAIPTTGTDVVPRWVVIGWLLKCCRKNYFEANAKLALFFDWLFFVESTDDIMSLEPAISLMVNSVPHYADMTQSLMEMLFLLVDHYDASRKEMLLQGVSAAFGAVVRRGVVPSLESLMQCTMINHRLKGRLRAFLHSFKGEVQNQNISSSKLEASNGMLSLTTKAKRVTAFGSEEGAESPSALVTKEADKRSLAFSKTEVSKEDSLSVNESMQEVSKEDPSCNKPESVNESVPERPSALETREIDNRSLPISKMEVSEENYSCNKPVSVNESTPELNKEVPSCNKPDSVDESMPERPSAFVTRKANKRSLSFSKTRLSALETRETNKRSLPISKMEVSKEDSSGDKPVSVNESMPELSKEVPSCNKPDSLDESVPERPSAFVTRKTNRRTLSFGKTRLSTFVTRETNKSSLSFSKMEVSKENSFCNKLVSVNESTPELSKEVPSCNKPDSVNESAPEVSKDVPFHNKPDFVNDSAPEVSKDDSFSNKLDPVNESVTLGIPAKVSRETQLPVNNKKVGYDLLKSLLDDLQNSNKRSEESNLRTLEKLLILFATSDFQAYEDGDAGSFSLFQQAFCSQISEAFKSAGHRIFLPLSVEEGVDDEVHSATTLLLQAYIFYPHERMRNMIMFWSEKGCPVGARLLSYASRLASEAYKLGEPQYANIADYDDVKHSLLKYHIAGYITFHVATPKASSNSYSVHALDLSLVTELVDNAFIAYTNLLNFRIEPPLQNGEYHFDAISKLALNHGIKGSDQTLAQLLHSDVLLCIEWNKTRSNEVLHSIFCYMSDVTVSKEEFIQLLLDLMDCTNLVSLQFEITLKKYRIFGQKVRSICEIVERSFHWDLSKQKKLWGLLVCEVLVSNITIEEVITELCTKCIDLSASPAAVEGLFTLIRFCSPTPKLIDAVVSLPAKLETFSAAVLVFWLSSKQTAFLVCMAEWLEKKQYSSLSSKGIAKLNISAFEALLKYFDEHTTKNENGTCMSIPEIQEKLGHFIKGNS